MEMQVKARMHKIHWLRAKPLLCRLAKRSLLLMLALAAICRWDSDEHDKSTACIIIILQMDETVMGRLYHHISGHESSAGTRIVLIAGLAILAHLTVKLIRHISEWVINKSQAQKNAFGFVSQQPKFITLTRLIVSGITFIIYFLALGFFLRIGFQPDGLSGQRLGHWPGDQLWFTGTGAGHGDWADVDFFRRHGGG